jgi:hypothetical protein
MDEKRSTLDRLGGLEGADQAALGIDDPATTAGPEATVDDEEATVPGARMDDLPRDQEKPWFTNLAAESDQAGVANDPSDAQEPQFPEADESRS